MNPKTTTPETGRKIFFTTLQGEFIGEVQKPKHSESGEEFIFFVCDHVKENKHWTFFTPSEVFCWSYQVAN